MAPDSVTVKVALAPSATDSSLAVTAAVRVLVSMTHVPAKGVPILTLAGCAASDTVTLIVSLASSRLSASTPFVLIVIVCSRSAVFARKVSVLIAGAV